MLTCRWNFTSGHLCICSWALVVEYFVQAHNLWITVRISVAVPCDLYHKVFCLKALFCLESSGLVLKLTVFTRWKVRLDVQSPFTGGLLVMISDYKQSWSRIGLFPART